MLWLVVAFLVGFVVDMARTGRESRDVWSSMLCGIRWAGALLLAVLALVLGPVGIGACALLFVAWAVSRAARGGKG